MAKKKQSVLTRDNLIAAAKELNDLMGLEPPLNTSKKDKKVTIQSLSKEIKDVMDDIDYENDKDSLNAKTFEVLQELGYEIPEEGGEEEEPEEPEEEEGGEGDEAPDYENALEELEEAEDLDELKEIAADVGCDLTLPKKKTSAKKKLKEWVEAKIAESGGEEEEEEEEEEQEEPEPEPAPKKSNKKSGGKGKSGKSGKSEDKPEKGPSAYGTAIEEMCKKPDMSKDDLVKKLEKKGIDTGSGKAAIQTAYGSVRKVVGLLRKNKFMD